MYAETLKLIGLKTFRANMSALLKKARKENIRFILMRHSEPIVEIRPLSKKERIFEKLAIQTAQGREEYRKGKYVTHEEVMKDLGLL